MELKNIESWTHEKPDEITISIDYIKKKIDYNFQFDVTSENLNKFITHIENFVNDKL